MAWVVCVREVRQVERFIEGGPRHGDCGRIPGVVRLQRVIEEVPRSRWHAVMAARAELPLHAGAGPCGTLARGRSWMPRFLNAHGFLAGYVDPHPRQYHRTPHPFGWSVRHLVQPLAAYFATYEPPMRFGAKATPRGRKPS